MNLTQILAIDDDSGWLEQIPLILEDQAAVTTTPSVDGGIELLSKHYFDIIILDLNFDGDDRSGSQIFQQIKALTNGANILVISGETDHRKLIEVFNTGVSKFLSKPSSNQEIRQTIIDIMEERARKSRVKSLIESESVSLIGKSRAMQTVRDQLNEIINTQIKDILITGESGTGKEVVAKYIVSHSGAKNYCPIHCGAISDGLAESELFGHVRGAFTGATSDRAGAFEAAEGGFVFLDELGEMPQSQQVKLLRILQERRVKRVGTTMEKPVQFRTIAATNRNLQNMIKDGDFREDLYYRVSKEVIELPPLRDRKEDIPELVEYFLESSYASKKLEFTQEALILLQKYSWPGNVRELSSVVDRLAVRSQGVIRASDLSLVLPEISYKKTRSKKYSKALVVERERFKQALLSTNFDREQAAKKLGVSRATYYRRAKELGLVQDRQRRGAVI